MNKYIGFPLMMVFGAIYFLYFGIVTLAIKKDTRKITYYNKMTDEEKERYDVLRLICIHSALAICFSLLLVCALIIYVFYPIQEIPIVIVTVLGLLVFVTICVVTKIPLIMSRKKKIG